MEASGSAGSCSEIVTPRGVQLEVRVKGLGDLGAPGSKGSNLVDSPPWRIFYRIRLPSLVCDFFEVTTTIGKGSGESRNRLPVGPHELILGDAGTARSLGLSMFGNMVRMCWFASTLRASSRTLHAADVSPFFSDYALCPKWGSSANDGLPCMVKVRCLRPIVCSTEER
jgi:hypothetical protein